jgi:hypothetical protein
MLRRVNAGLFEEDEGANVQLAVKATNNGGVEAAQFDYDSTVLDRDVGKSVTNNGGTPLIGFGVNCAVCPTRSR